MKCFTCGADMTGKEFCDSCGAPDEVPTGNMKVEYKVFQKSELLEIGRKKDEGAQKEETRTVRAKATTRRAAAASESWSDKRKVFVIIAVILVSALIGSVFYFWRFFFFR